MTWPKLSLSLITRLIHSTNSNAYTLFCLFSRPTFIFYCLTFHVWFMICLLWSADSSISALTRNNSTFFSLCVATNTTLQSEILNYTTFYWITLQRFLFGPETVLWKVWYIVKPSNGNGNIENMLKRNRHKCVKWMGVLIAETDFDTLNSD